MIEHRDKTHSSNFVITVGSQGHKKLVTENKFIDIQTNICLGCLQKCPACRLQILRLSLPRISYVSAWRDFLFTLVVCCINVELRWKFRGRIFPTKVWFNLRYTTLKNLHFHFFPSQPSWNYIIPNYSTSNFQRPIFENKLLHFFLQYSRVSLFNFSVVIRLIRIALVLF